MHTASSHPAQTVETQTIAIAATFTAEPIEDALAFWMQELGFSQRLEFAPYNQVFQQLLDPFSLFAQNQQGVNVILLRFEDWLRDEPNITTTTAAEKINRNVEDLMTALQAAVARSATPYLLCFCPASPHMQANAAFMALFQQAEAQMAEQLGPVAGLSLIREADLAVYPVDDYYDAKRDQLGHIPFTPIFFAALGTALARRIHTLKSAPYKVIVLDCDNTLWKGVVGEDGVAGLEISAGWQALQSFMVAQQQAGMLICLCSKNNEADALEVFEQRSDMILRLEHIVAWRINWLPKSENIKSLAQELNLGLDSFIFIDDNPVECAEVQANCPGVLSLQLPLDGDIPQFLHHVWAFDRLKVTSEDKQRTLLYKQNLERDRFQKQALTIDDFLAGLNLQINIAEPTPEQLSRVAQLTQRTNQFNFTTIRRSESEIQNLAETGLECRIVEVSDRFGDYGLVGVLLFRVTAEVLEIDTFLLSCRVLGRGVEHAMLSHLGKLAQERQLASVQASFIPTKKNLPARNFLESVASAFQQTAEVGDRFVLPTEVAAALSYQPGAAESAESGPSSGEPATVANQPVSRTDSTPQSSKSQRLRRIALELWQPEQVLAKLDSQQRAERQLDQPYIAPRTVLEKQLADLWAKLLRLELVGIQDNYFDLGGTSLLSVELFAQIEQQFGKKLPLTALLEAPTIEQLAHLIEGSTATDSLVLIRKGGSKPVVFLVHDGDGETMLYRNLAYRLDPQHPVYGLQPYSQGDSPILHSRIEEMAAYHITKMRTVQPQGPYLVGGMCAGGVIAFEIARQLQQQGESVALVGLIDAADVAAPLKVGRIANARLQRFSSLFGEDASLKPHQRALSLVSKVGQKITGVIGYEVQSRLKTARDRLQMKLFRYYLDRGLTLPKFLRQLSVRTVYVFAEQDYAPEQPFAGEVVLFRATSGEGNDEPYIDRYSDPLLGWGQRVTETVRVYDIPGGHSSMLQDPNVDVLAAHMQAYIDAALAEKPEKSYSLSLVGEA